ncbi:MAG: hypothetical protein OJF47_002958 [Nitrospira sp.]|nr:MAG: hypothetical protein OJF47_002958 [Nitrospira sp.]
MGSAVDGCDRRTAGWSVIHKNRVWAVGPMLMKTWISNGL